MLLFFSCWLGYLAVGVSILYLSIKYTTLNLGDMFIEHDSKDSTFLSGWGSLYILLWPMVVMFGLIYFIQHLSFWKYFKPKV